VAAPKKEHAEVLAQEFKGLKALPDVPALAADGQVEAVFVAIARKKKKMEAVKLLLESGKHVLLPSPSGLVAAGLEELVGLAAEKSAALMEDDPCRLSPLGEKIAEALTDVGYGNTTLVVLGGCDVKLGSKRKEAVMKRRARSALGLAAMAMNIQKGPDEVASERVTRRLKSLLIGQSDQGRVRSQGLAARVRSEDAGSGRRR